MVRRSQKETGLLWWHVRKEVILVINTSFMFSPNSWRYADLSKEATASVAIRRTLLPFVRASSLSFKRWEGHSFQQDLRRLFKIVYPATAFYGKWEARSKNRGLTHCTRKFLIIFCSENELLLKARMPFSVYGSPVFLYACESQIKAIEPRFICDLIHSMQAVWWLQLKPSPVDTHLSEQSVL